MLLYISEDTFTSPVTAETMTAVRHALSASEWGFCRLLVSPKATIAAREQGLDEVLVQGLDIVQRGWLEGQSLLCQLNRVVALVDESDRHGSLRGNIFEVATASAVGCGIFKEPALVTENFATDGAFLSLVFSLWSGASGEELGRFWQVRLEQGGGDPIRNFVGRYVARPEPMGIVCDRDSVGLPACGNTVRGCVTDLVQHGLFATRDEAKNGGFSLVAANFTFEVLRAWSLECLMLPQMAELMLDRLMNHREAQDRRSALLAAFPTYPSLSREDAERWLVTDFKRFLDGGSAWNSGALQRLTAWAHSDPANFQDLKVAFDGCYECAPFTTAVDRICTMLASLGARDGRLM